MAKVDERAEMIGASILSQAEQERKSLIEKANAIREHELGDFEEQLIQEMFGKLQKQSSALRHDAMKSVSVTKTEKHRELLRRREELMNQLFSDVRARLVEYADTPEYRDAVLCEIKSLKSDYDHSASTVMLRECDMALAVQIGDFLKGCKVIADTTVKCGGWKLENVAAGILIDETLDTRLESQRMWFLQNSGLAIGSAAKKHGGKERSQEA